MRQPGNFQGDGEFGAAVFAIVIFGGIALLAVVGLVIFAAAMISAAGAVAHAVALSIDANGGFLAGWGEDAVYGLITGLVIGLIRAFARIRWRMTESLIGALFSSRLAQILRSMPGAWSLIFFTVATSTLVGYAVGVFMDSTGAPSFFDSDFTGPVATLIGSGGGSGGGGGLLIALCIALVLILACLVLAIVVAMASNIILAMLIGCVGGSIKGATKAFAIATIEASTQGGSPPPAKRPLALLCKDGAITGSVVGLITSFLFAVNGVTTHGATDGGGIHKVFLSAMVWVWSSVLVPLGSWLIYLLPLIIVLPSIIGASRR